MKKQILKFGQLVKAVLTQDEAQLVGLKNERIAQSSIKGQISALESAIVHAELKVETAEEKFQNAIINKVGDGIALITNGSDYVANLASANNHLMDCHRELEELKASLEFYKTLLEERF